MSGVIYKIVTGNEVYVGSTTDYKQRIRRHRYNLLNKSSSCYELKLYKAIRANDGEWEISIYEDNLSMTKDKLRKGLIQPNPDDWEEMEFMDRIKQDKREAAKKNKKKNKK